MSKKATQAARVILKRVGDRIPVDVYAIARDHNIAVRTQALEDNVSGVLVIKDGRAIIGVNETHHPNRQRFSIAHELGHFLLHRDHARVFVDASPLFFRNENSSDGSRLQEIEANTFAAELLMPESVIREQLDNTLIDALDDNAVRRLAARFGVSAQALTIRLTRLALITA